MNIVIITTDEPIYLPLTLQKLSDTVCGECIRRIILLPPTTSKKSWKNVLEEQLRFGLIYFICRAIQYQTYKMLGRTKLKVGGRYFSIEAVSSAHGIPLSKIRSINSDESISLIKKEAPDLIVSLSASQIFSKRVIGLANWATINVHNAPLPKYQGLMPSFWVLCNGETETATTVHLVAEKIDAGDMVVQKRVEIDGDETLNSLITKTKLITVDVLVEAFNLFQEHGGRPPTKAMAQEEATYFSFPERKDIARFRRAGRRLLWKHIY